jgi:hypothetical protein
MKEGIPQGTKRARYRALYPFFAESRAQATTKPRERVMRVERIAQARVIPREIRKALSSKRDM